MTWKSYALLSVPGFVATYLFTAPPRPAAEPPVSRRAEAARQQAAGDIADLAVSLQMRVRAAAEYRHADRNPFRFAKRPAADAGARPADAPAIVDVLPPPDVPPPLPLSLIGMTADGEGDSVQRTAIINTGRDVLLVREGDTVAGVYTASKLFDGGIELTGADGTIRRLSFKP